MREYVKNRWKKIVAEDGDRLERCREANRDYVESNVEREKERCRVKALKYYYANKEKCKKRNKEWRTNNKEKVRTQRRKYERNRLKEDPVYRFKHQTRNFINQTFLRLHTEKFEKKNKELTGLTNDELAVYLLKTFKDNYGYDWDFKESVDIDHIVPLSSAKTLDEAIKLFHYTNLQLLKRKDNQSKGARTDWVLGA
jgi:hypothetical protein